MIRRFTVAALCMTNPLTYVARGANINGEASYISFSLPGTLGTYPEGINASMTVTGFYYVSPTVARGFIREADGTLITVDVPGATFTQPESINAAGDITGYYFAPGAETTLGFLRYANGHFITFAANQTNPYLAVVPVAINDYDEIAGSYQFHSTTAFTRSRTGKFINLPGPAGGAAMAINASGSVVGFYDTGVNHVHAGFVAHPDGYWTQFAIAGGSACSNQTIPLAINAVGTIAGVFRENDPYVVGCNAQGSAFVRSPDGELTQFQPPGQLPEVDEYSPVPDAFIYAPQWISIDHAGDITGSYTDAMGQYHGFVRNPYGTITSFDPPKSQYTLVTSMNDGGAIAGYYYYSSTEGTVGFIRVPSP